MMASRGDATRLVVAALPLATALVAAGLAVALGRDQLEVLAATSAVGVAALILVLWGRAAPAPAATERPHDPNASPIDADAVARLACQVADLNPDALVLHSNDGRIIYANVAARELFFEGQDPSHRNFLRLLVDAPAPLREALLADSDQLFAVEVDHQQETYHLTRRNVSVGGDNHTMLVLRHLTREVARREVAMLKSAVRVISHEVNNSLAPIASLVNSARLIADKPEHASKLASVFDTIEERALHLKTFLDGYAGLARLPPPRPARGNWEPLLQHLRAIHPEVALPSPPSAPGWFDAVQLEQVLLNLLKNAIEAGSPAADVTLEARVDADDATRLVVMDRGPGFLDEALSNALLPFYTTKERGSGMGLALCREVVEAHGGSIVLSNRADGGACVTVTLPGPRRPDAGSIRSGVKLTLSHS